MKNLNINFNISVRLYILLVLCTFFSTKIWGYEYINNINENDKSYKKLQNTKNTNQSILSIFEYQLKEKDTLLSISQDTKISISALISLNRSASISQYKQGDYILIPSQKGIFIAIDPINDMEFLIFRRLFSLLTTEHPISINFKKNNTKSYLVYFLENKVLTKLEYTLWQSENFRVPVLQGYVTSYFGSRISPISGDIIYHNGIDIAAKSGSEIFASKSGVVKREGYNSTFGYFIVITHDDQYSSLYGHLLDSKINVNDRVQAGEHIGYMGSTGASTGSHLHFEIFNHDKQIDPLKVLKFE